MEKRLYCDGGFNTPNGKTTNCLERFSKRYEIVSIIDHKYAGQDAGLDIERR